MPFVFNLFRRVSVSPHHRVDLWCLVPSIHCPLLAACCHLSSVLCPLTFPVSRVSPDLPSRLICRPQTHQAHPIGYFGVIDGDRDLAAT